MKVKLFAWWEGCESLLHRFKKQFIGNHFADSRVQLVLDDTYDIAVIFGYTKEKIKTDKDHTLYFIQEPSWSSNWDRFAHEKSNRVYCPSREAYGNTAEYITHPPYMFYGGHGDEYFEVDTILNYRNIKKPNKTSFIVTYRSTSPLTGSTEGNIYMQRVLLAEHLLKTNSDVDIYGQQWEYSDIKNNLKLKKHIYTKFLGLDSYMYSVAIENSTEYNYITEKLYDVIFFNTIPVYAGAPNIAEHELFKDIVIHLPNIYDTEACANIINNLTPEYYEHHSKKLYDIKYNILSSHNFNMWKKIIKEII